MRFSRLAFLVAAFLLLSVLSVASQDSAGQSEPATDQAAKPDTEASRSGTEVCWIAKIDMIAKSEGKETKSTKQVWRKGLKERVEEDVPTGKQTTIIDAEQGCRFVISPTGKYATKYLLPERGEEYYRQRTASGMVERMRKEGAEVTGPDEVGTEQICGIECAIKEISVRPSEDVRKRNPQIPELVMFRVWEAKQPAGLPEALRVAQVTKDMGVSELVVTSLQRDAAIEESLFEVPEGMPVYDAAAATEAVKKKIQEGMEKQGKEKEQQESGGGDSGSGSGGG